MPGGHLQPAHHGDGNVAEVADERRRRRHQAREELGAETGLVASSLKPAELLARCGRWPNVLTTVNPL